jgi:hypothetical protein
MIIQQRITLFLFVFYTIPLNPLFFQTNHKFVSLSMPLTSPMFLSSDKSNCFGREIPRNLNRQALLGFLRMRNRMSLFGRNTLSFLRMLLVGKVSLSFRILKCMLISLCLKCIYARKYPEQLQPKLSQLIEVLYPNHNLQIEPPRIELTQ